MTSAPTSDGPGAATQATGNSRRSLARRIAVCAAIAGGVLVSGTAGWWLQSAMHPATAAATTEDAHENTVADFPVHGDQPGDLPGHAADDAAESNDAHDSIGRHSPGAPATSALESHGADAAGSAATAASGIN
ncbi:MAG: hypothetical protein JNG89_08445, partial [Planctomycetaceae bacterium]|nr:hypothetical protein [Planctomycetaceae bacterium]